MSWQELVVALLLLLCIVRIGMNVIAFFRKTGGKANPCANCPTGCELKRKFDEKQRECADRQADAKGKKHRHTQAPPSCCH